jgi:hypothetical protein
MMTLLSSDAAQTVEQNRNAAGAGMAADSESGHAQDKQALEALIEEHILPKLDPDFRAYFASNQARLKTLPQQPAPNPPIHLVRAHPEAYRPPCALDASGYPGVADFNCTSEDSAKIPVRVYYPDAAKHGAGPHPVHLNFHGLCFPFLSPTIRVMLKSMTSPAK